MLYSNEIIRKIFFGLICMIIFQSLEGNFSSAKAMNLREEKATSQLGNDEVFQLNSNENSCSITDPRCLPNEQL